MEHIALVNTNTHTHVIYDGQFDSVQVLCEVVALLRKGGGGAAAMALVAEGNDAIESHGSRQCKIRRTEHTSSLRAQSLC